MQNGQRRVKRMAGAAEELWLLPRSHEEEPENSLRLDELNSEKYTPETRKITRKSTILRIKNHKIVHRTKIQC